MKEKIRKWELEIEKIIVRQKEMTAKNNENIRELRKKIEEAERQERMENNQLIADSVRTIYGEITPENVEAFKEQMQAMLQNSPQEKSLKEHESVTNGQM